MFEQEYTSCTRPAPRILNLAQRKHRRASKRALQAETPHGKVSGGCAGDQNLTRSEEETVKPALYSPQSPSVIDGGDGEDGKVHISGNEDGGTQGTAETPTETGGIETMP